MASAAELYDLTGRVAIVTGGGTGIGAATAMLLAEHGADVVIAARTVADLEATSAKVEASTSRRCVAVPTDVKVEEAVINLVRVTIAELGRIDILVNNAGGTRMSPLSEIPTRAWDSSFELNLRSAYLATREAGRHMVAQGGGAIVNVSSGAGLHGVMGGAHYSSSKAASADVHACHRGRVGSPRAPRQLRRRRRNRFRTSLGRLGDGGNRSGAPSPGTALDRVGQPVEVAQVIHFLACDASSYVSGETISVNGGPSLGGI